MRSSRVVDSLASGRTPRPSPLRRGLQLPPSSRCSAAAPRHQGGLHHGARRRLPHRQAHGGHHRERGRVLQRELEPLQRAPGLAVTCPPRTGPDPVRGSRPDEGSRQGAEAGHGGADHRHAAGGGGRPGPGGERGHGRPAARGRGADGLPLAAGGRRPAGGPGEAAQGAGARERAAEDAGGRPGAGQRRSQGGRVGKFLRPARRRAGARRQTGPFGSQLHADEYIVGGVPVINPSNLVDRRLRPGDEDTIAMGGSIASGHAARGDRPSVRAAHPRRPAGTPQALA